MWKFIGIPNEASPVQQKAFSRAKNFSWESLITSGRKSEAGKEILPKTTFSSPRGGSNFFGLSYFSSLLHLRKLVLYYDTSGEALAAAEATSKLRLSPPPIGPPRSLYTLGSYTWKSLFLCEIEPMLFEVSGNFCFAPA